VPLTARLFVIGVSLVFFFVVLRMIRRRTLGLEYSILWFVLTGLALVAGLVQKQADAFSRLIGIDYPPAFFFFLCIVVLLAIVLHLTVRLARLAEAHRALAREIALLRAEWTDRVGGGAGEKGRENS
jgi:hypothetical protein